MNKPREEKTITTQQILKANPDDVMTQRQFSKDKENYEYVLNVKYTTLGDKPLARFYFDDDTTVSLYDENGKLEWSDWYSKYKAWERNGEFVEIN
jgi:hypothetical protein